MRDRKIWNRLIGVLPTLALALFCAGTASAAEFWLRADAFTKIMPDAAEITMWGFAECTANHVTCSAATVPGPRLVVPPGDSTLIIHLENNLTGPFTEPVSLVVPGQTAVMSPVWINTAGTVVSTGSRPPGDVTSRMRSFTSETAVGSAGTYTWNNLKPGTYRYQSGTHPAVQVQMGLYGAVTHDAAALTAYNGVPYDSDVVLLFSEIDPALHSAVATNNYGPGKMMTSTIAFRPKYFLINGVPFTAGSPPIFAGRVGERTLIRFLNAGLRDYAPVLQGIYMDILSEDGNLFPYPRKQYSLMLPAGKTVDAVVTPPAGLIPVYDRRLNLTNNNISPGGMLTYLEFGEVPNIAVSPLSYDFGVVSAGTVPVQTFTITNSGLGNLIVGVLSLTGVDAAKFSVVADACSSSTVAPTASCSFGVAFHPTYAGLRTAELIIPSNDPGTPLSVPVSGTEVLCAVTFADVPGGYLFEDPIKAMFCNGITSGCSTAPLNFCPLDTLTRKEAAAFITKVMNQAPAASCTGAVFADVNAASVGTGFCRYIEAFSTLGITAGCQADNPATPANEALFCPESLVLREQMASFLTNGFLK